MNTELLKQTFERAKRENGGLAQFGVAFYDRLFFKYPEVRPLFNSPPAEQQKKLVASIGAIVAGAERPDTLAPYLHAMGVRHNAYKVKENYYPAVAENLVAVPSQHLSREGQWTDEMKQTWDAALALVCQLMIEAANNPQKYEHELLAVGYQSDGFRYKPGHNMLAPERSAPAQQRSSRV